MPCKMLPFPTIVFQNWKWFYVVLKLAPLQPFFMGMISSWKDLSQTAEQLPGTESFPASAGLTDGSLFVHLSINIFEKNYLF